MDFLDHIYLDNSIRSYCIVAGSILLMLILKRYLSRYIASLLFRLTRRIWNSAEKKSFVELLAAPLKWFLLILITVIAIDKLNFPTAWEYRIYGHSTNEIISRLGIGIIIVSFTWLLLRMTDFIAMVLEEKAARTDEKSKDQLIVFFRDFLKVIITLVSLLLLIKACFNQHIGNILTSLSIVGAIVALAAKESLENLIASFIIFFDKPFATGDVLKVNAVTGTVERIGLRSTRIRTADKTLVTVPNKQMVDSVVDNWSMRTQRRAEIKLELSPNTPVNTATGFMTAIKKILGSAAEGISGSSVHFTELNKSGITISIEYFTQPITIEEFNSLKEEMNIALKTAMEENNISMAAAVNSVTIINDNKEG